MQHTTKLLSLALALLMLTSVFTALPLTAGAATSSINSTCSLCGDFEYYILDDGTVSIEDYFGDATVLEIPYSLDGRTVTRIASSAFYACETLEEVIIHDYITGIGKCAFENCTNLSSITIYESENFIEIEKDAFKNTAWYKNQPDGVVYVGNVAYTCKGECPKTVVLKEGTVVIAEYAFLDCETLENITIPESVKFMGDRAFENCTSLKSVTIPKNLKKVSWHAFDNCTSLKSVTISEGVEYIDTSAFENCTSLKSVTIPQSVTMISIMAFGYYSYTEEKTDPETGHHISTTTVKKMENFTIKGYRDTAAYTYAFAYRFTFVNLGEPEPTITLKNPPKKLYIKGTAKIKATIKNGKGTTTYKSSNNKVAKVDANGKITALKDGAVTITVKNNGVSKKFTLVVYKPFLSDEKKAIKKGRTYKLKITGGVGLPKYSSSKKTVATVNERGKITARHKGKATITVNTNGMKLKCKVTVFN